MDRKLHYKHRPETVEAKREKRRVAQNGITSIHVLFKER